MKTDYFFGLSSGGFHRLAYREWGEPTNPIPVICVHGMTRNSHDFDKIAKHLSDTGRHVYCPDVVGRGDSDWLKDPTHYSFEQYAADMNALIARTGATQVDWVGTSMGGLIGIILASCDNSPIRRLVLNDIGPQIPVKALQRLAKYGGRFPDFSSVDQATQYFKAAYADFGDLSDEQWRRLAESTIKEVAPNHYVSKVDPGIKYSTSKGAFLWSLLTQPRKALQGIFFDVDIWNLWKNIKCPVYLVHGRQSDLLLPETITEMRKSHPKLETLEIPNAGHAPTLESPLELETITRWLS